jgi:hypothetical protein
MADIYLGPTASAITPLPPIRWTGGGDPGLPIDYSKQADKSSMLSGAQRFNIRSKQPHRWTLTWEMLTAAELADMIVLNEHNHELYFQNNWESADWKEVVITGFEYNVVINAGSVGCRYGLTMTLEEVL